MAKARIYLDGDGGSSPDFEYEEAGLRDAVMSALRAIEAERPHAAEVVDDSGAVAARYEGWGPNPGWAYNDGGKGGLEADLDPEARALLEGLQAGNVGLYRGNDPGLEGFYTEQDLRRMYEETVDKAEYPEYGDWRWDMSRSATFTGASREAPMLARRQEPFSKTAEHARASAAAEAGARDGKAGPAPSR